MEDFEEGELLESDEEQNDDLHRTDVTKPSDSIENRGAWGSRHPVPNYRSTGKLTLSSSEDSSDSEREEDDDELLFKRKKSRQSDKNGHGMDFQPSATFQNPLLNKSQPSWVGMMSKQKHRNNIWGSVLQEQTLSQGLGGFGVDQSKTDLKSDRSVETYDYTKAAEDHRPIIEAGDDGTVVSNDPFDQVLQTDHSALEKNMQSRTGIDRKRKRPIRDRLGSFSHDKHKSRDHIKVTEDDPEEKVVSAITVALNEPKKELMERVVKVVGVKKAIQLLYETEDVEDAGGLWINDGSRRRTPGGVYLQLLKADPSVTKDHLKDIFIESFMYDKEKQKEAKRRKRRRKAEEARRRMEIGLRTMDAKGHETNLEEKTSDRKDYSGSDNPRFMHCDPDNEMDEDRDESDDEIKDFESLLRKHKEVQEKKKTEVSNMESQITEVSGINMENEDVAEPEISIDIEEGESID
ncbi:phosphorylated adapter RNA export protein [Lingula anatina]|uniref:Phosphorylated adapter RNA export protein n=1 Tax=Lingula anatina TaxID=7574 RepID=A0A1S3JKD4_LINAN|nr:phosphorylated adapter RNA export protein [Lingula anatina]|eukprot:XP_013410586.1 phosphorylated adapter RNA export protein [Lingula anatina]